MGLHKGPREVDGILVFHCQPAVIVSSPHP
jgi:hypothetical protein